MRVKFAWFDLGTRLGVALQIGGWRKGWMTPIRRPPPAKWR